MEPKVKGEGEGLISHPKVGDRQAPSPRELARRLLPRLREGFLFIAFRRESAVPPSGSTDEFFSTDKIYQRTRQSTDKRNFVGAFY